MTSALLNLIFLVLFNSLYISYYKNSKFYYVEGYSFYLFFCVLLGSDCYVCSVWSFMHSLVKYVFSDYSGKKYSRGRSVLEIRSEIMSSQLEGRAQFPVGNFVFVRRDC